jgi:hypothetical protein
VGVVVSAAVSACDAGFVVGGSGRLVGVGLVVGGPGGRVRRIGDQRGTGSPDGAPDLVMVVDPQHHRAGPPDPQHRSRASRLAGCISRSICIYCAGC